MAVKATTIQTRLPKKSTIRVPMKKGTKRKIRKVIKG
jgi:hypothetical protein